MNNQHPGVSQPIVTRLIPTPEGVPQVVSLVAGWWDCLDWMIAQKGESLEFISHVCWNFVRNNPEESFATAFNYYLDDFMMKHQTERDGLANDNNRYAAPDWADRPHPYRIKLTKKLSFCAG
jgi:hypothetical protein